MRHFLRPSAESIFLVIVLVATFFCNLFVAHPFVRGLSCLLGIGIWQLYQNHRMNQWKYRATIDPLTDLLNRQHIETLCAGLTAPRYMVYVIDCDEFKQINDLYGHAKGDEALRWIGRAMTCSNQNGSRDLLGRWGGDEFVWIHELTSAEERFDGLTRLLGHVEEAQRMSGLPLSISVGHSLWLPHTQSFSDSFQEADRVLYQVKHFRNLASLDEESSFPS